MGIPQRPEPVKLVAGLLAVTQAQLEEAAAALGERFGPIDASSETSTWAHSTYYATEMGDHLLRRFLSCEQFVAPGKLAGIKQLTTEMETHWRSGGGRCVNIDPGYLTATKLVLASTKDAAHRVYLSGGIYAEVTLLFQHGSFQGQAHTYPDYAAADAVAFFNRVRATYLAQLRRLH
jgi:hypothetical protein